MLEFTGCDLSGADFDEDTNSFELETSWLNSGSEGISTASSTKEDPQTILAKELYSPIPVVILTHEQEIQGLVHVERSNREDRKISEWLNDPRRRFMAVTNAQVTQRKNPVQAVAYDFLMLHVDSIVMLHPLLQRHSKAPSNSQAVEQSLQRLQQFRAKLVQQNISVI